MMIYMKKNIFKVVLLCSLTMAFSSCELELQKDYDYEASVADPHVYMSAWDYMNTRKDVFSEFIEAIEYAEMKEYYQQTDKKYTFLALNNTAMENYRMNEFPGTSSITECDKDKVKDLLAYHIVEGEYSSYGQFQIEPMFVLTMLKGEKGLMTMLVYKEPWQQVVGQIVVNQYGSNGHSPSRRSVTSNILPTNGVIHVFGDYCKYVK